MNFITHLMGLDNSNSTAYLWWSGFGPDLAMFAGVASFLRRHNCHVQGCWRLGRHLVEDTVYWVCRHHLPSGPISHQNVIDAHNNAKES